MADNKTQINRRINPYLSFSLIKALFAFLIFLELHVVVLHVSATNQCTEFQFLVLYADGTSSCVDCESCPPGQGLSHECGTTISSSEMVHCKPCIQGSSFSTYYDTSSCIPCSASCSEDQLVNQPCTTTSDVKCAKQCNSKDRYYDELTGDCQQCSKCCGDSEDIIEEECKRKVGAALNMICSIHSSVNRCEKRTDTLIPSPQDTTASQTDKNTNASPQETTGSKNPSTAAFLEKTRESHKDIAKESPKVSATFWSNFTHQNTGTATSFGERSLPASYKAKGHKHQVGIIVGSTAAMFILVLGLPLFVGYVRWSRSPSRSPQANSDAERGDYHPVTGHRAGKKCMKSWVVKWKPSKTESCNSLCEGVIKNPAASLTCACQMDTQKESKLMTSLLNQESTLERLCQMLDTDVPMAGDYKAVAKHYNFDYYQIASVLGHADHPGASTRTRKLIEWLVSVNPELTVEEFVTVVAKTTKRNDVMNMLRDYDKAQKNEV